MSPPDFGTSFDSPPRYELNRTTGRRAAGSARGDGPRILIVDDSPSARRLMQALLTRLGIGLPDLRITATVPEALQVFTSWKPEIVIVDIELRPPPDRPAPGPEALDGLPRDGIELVQHLMKRDPEVRFIVCSASDPAGSALSGLIRDGTIQAVVKPVVAAKIREVLTRALAARDGARPPRRPVDG